MSAPNPVRMTCPRCAVSTISPEIGTCDVCGFRADESVAVDGANALLETITRELSHEFDVVDIVGRRELALVLRAIERSSDRIVLLTVLRRSGDSAAEARFRTMMEVYQRLDHPHLLPVLRFGSSDSLLWCIAPVQDAKPIRDRLTSEKRLDPRATRRIATQLVSALEYLHRRGMVHGAISADSVFIDDKGWVWLSDAGIAGFAPPQNRNPLPPSPPSVSTDARSMRPAWLAPEDVDRSERQPTSDQFALAALLFECVAGEPPLEPGERVARFRPEVPLPMSEAIARGLHAQPHRRFASCSDFLAALEQDTPTTVPAEDRAQDWAQAAPLPRQSSRTTSQEALLIPDWEPPEEGVAPRRQPAKLVVALVVVLALALAVPALLQTFREAREPALTGVGVPMTVPEAPTPPQVAPSEASRITAAAPATSSRPVRQQTSPAPNLRSDTERPPVAPSSIPRASSAPAAPPPTSAAVPATLFINASPWGQVFIDDVLVGNTPRANLQVAPGEHVLRVSRQGFSTFTRTVRLQPGETVRITDIVLTPVSP